MIILDGNAMNPGDLSWDEMAELGELTVYARTPAELLPERLAEAEAVFTNEVFLDRSTLAACSKLRYIGVLATGYNVVDIGEAARQGIVVTNVPDYATQAVAQFTFALLLEVCHRVAGMDQAVRAGEWEANPDFTHWPHPMIELVGKTFGVVGYGRIGRQAARLAEAFGMRVVASGRAGGNTRDGELVGLDSVLAQADVLSLHCPLTKESENMIDASAIGKMRDGVIFLNTARGRLVVEKDLAQALASGKVRAAGLDVASLEPIRPDNPLLAAPNCFITPHVAWAPRDTRERLLRMVIDNFRAYLEGHPVNQVTPR
jgi:glycerate dehydrogenase